MTSVKFKGNPVTIQGDIPQKGQKAEDFKFVKDDLSEGTLYNFDNKIKVILAVPSLDTGVCATETKKFSQKLSGKSSVEGVVISKDLPFAMKRYCETQGVDNITNASDFRYNDFGNKYNTDMNDGPLKGLSSRAVFIIDGENIIQYAELVPEITQEPEYDKALEVVERLESKSV